MRLASAFAGAVCACKFEAVGSYGPMARDRGGPKLAAQILVYPMLDHRVGGTSDPWRNRHTGEFVWSRDSNQFGWGALRGDYAANDERKGWFSPSLADDLAGLPPITSDSGGVSGNQQLLGGITFLICPT